MNPQLEKLWYFMKKEEKIIKLGDIIVIAVLLMASLAIFISSLPSENKEVAEAVVSINGQEYARYPLDTDAVFTVEQEGHINVIEIQNGAVRVKSANCPDRTCVNQGFISKGGEVIVCLPARLTVTLDGAGEQIDTVVY